MNEKGTSVNTKLSKPPTSGTKLYSVTSLPKSKVSPKVVEKNDLSKSVTSHFTTNKIMYVSASCHFTKVHALCLLKIKSEPINAYFKNNRDVHRDYLNVTKEYVATLHELLEEARALKPLDEHIGHASKFAERIQELLVYVSASCPFTQSGNEKWALATSHRKNNKPYIDASRTKQTIETITQKQVVKQNTQKANNTMLPSTRIVSSTNASGSNPRINTKNDMIQRTSSRSKKNNVEAQPRKFKSSTNKNNHVSGCNANVKNVSWVFTLVGLRWKPTGRTFNMEGKIIQTSPSTIVPPGNRLHTIRIFVVAPNAETRMRYSIAQNSLIRAHINSYGHPFNPPNFAFARNSAIPKQSSWNFGFLGIVEIVFWYLYSGCFKHKTRHRDKLVNIVSKFIGTVRFDNDHFVAIVGYRDLQMGNILISHVYYVEGLGHNLFFVGQFCDSDLEVAFRKHTCFVRNLEGVDLLLGTRGSNLFTISMTDMMNSFPICLLSKVSKTKSWLWHRRLSHLYFGTINQLAKQGLVKGLPKLKYTKDHLCSACQMGKSKKESHPHKPEPSTNKKLQMLHMDLTKDEALEIIIKFLKQAQVSLKATVGITHHTSTARTPQQNGVVERRNHTLVEAARTMLIFSKSSRFLWAEAVATACYTQNCSLIHTHYNKTPYELLIDRKPELKNLYVFGAICYPTNDFEDLGKLRPKVDIGIFIGYSPSKKAYQIYNKRTKQIMETMNVKFDELTQTVVTP
ncbi:retrovirus-related pol polyprotein from transposon TNT 1-94 [Tanacetum coccineum]